MTDVARLDDLVTFARIEVEANDLEPWAEMIRALADAGRLDADETLWLIKLYNAYDDFASAWSVFRRWGSPFVWSVAPDGGDAGHYPCTQERRNLRGGRVLRHLDSYVAHLAGVADDQAAWTTRPLAGDDPERDFLRLLAHLRAVWGVGRQTAFEWAEFLAKAAGVAVSAPDAQLWESEGPRRSIQRLYGNDRPDLAWLNEHATHARNYLAERGVALSWEDFETVICDFNVMRDGRYYPGRHLAALREEVESVADPDDRALLVATFQRIAPEPWRGIAPGIDKALLAVYRDTGRIVTPAEAAAA